MSVPSITLEGRLTKDPELAFTQTGEAYIKGLSIACNQRKFNKATQEWENGTTLFYSVSAFGTLAENIAESLRKGVAVVVSGVMAPPYAFVDKEGRPGTTMQVKANDVSVSLRGATVQVTPNQRQEHNMNAGYVDNYDEFAIG